MENTIIVNSELKLDKNEFWLQKSLLTSLISQAYLDGNDALGEHLEGILGIMDKIQDDAEDGEAFDSNESDDSLHSAAEVVEAMMPESLAVKKN